MGYDKIPNFDDPYAKIKERIHLQSGAKIVEVLYGAKNPDGTPKYPEKEDGHGHFVALEIDGLYQMIMWRHPDSEGGYQEYGDYGEYDADRNHNPLKDLEDGIEEKRELLDKAKKMMGDKNYSTSSVDDILTCFDRIFDMNTPEEQKLRQKYNEILEKNNRNKDRLREQERNAEQKRALILQAQGIQYSEDWKAASAQMKELMDRWKEIGNAGIANDLLWSDFQNARKTFFERQHKHYIELDNLRAQRKKQKQEIISEAQSVAQYSTDWHGTHERLEELLSRWKQVGSAGKDEDDRLWSEFQNIRNDFYARRKVAGEKRESELLAKRQAKADLVSEAQAYARSYDYNASTADRMKKMSEEWKSIGFCGKDYEDQLWSQFRMAQDTYWQGKKSYGEEKHKAWIAKTQEAVERRKRRIGNIQQNIENLTERLNTTQNYDKQNQIEGWISEDEAKIRELEEEIYRMELELGRG